MQNFHPRNNKSNNENKVQKNLIQISKTDTKSVVDINILLNRVKIEEKNEVKKKYVFFSSITLGLCLFFYFLTVV
tara:strand:+ start:153 stop:377 length:225 start_codon:yes stop_codon:yes gene_type:complete